MLPVLFGIRQCHCYHGSVHVKLFGMRSLLKGLSSGCDGSSVRGETSDSVGVSFRIGAIGWTFRKEPVVALVVLSGKRTRLTRVSSVSFGVSISGGGGTLETRLAHLTHHPDIYHTNRKSFHPTSE